MAARFIISVEPASGRGEAVVMEVQQEGTAHPLDLRLVGCEGENPYVTSIKQRNLGKLKHKFKGTDDEWASVLSYFLLQKQPEQASILDGVRMVYALKNDNLELSIRQDVQGIKVTLGEIVVPRDEEFEFNPFHWAQASATAHAQTLQRLADLNAQARGEQKTIAKLKAQLEDFIKTKDETETAMLQQFMELLNEKKRKIRDQSRLLAGAKVDEDTANTVQSARASMKPDTKTRKAGASRMSKRKAPARAAAKSDPEAESDSDHMEIDQTKVEEPDDEALEPATPDRFDDETEAEDERPALEPSDRSVNAQTSTAGDEGSTGVPPPRSLPFGRRATTSKAVVKKASPPVGDDEDETDDEEL